MGVGDFDADPFRSRSVLARENACAGWLSDLRRADRMAMLLTVNLGRSLNGSSKT